jgi:hypothetical protein
MAAADFEDTLFQTIATLIHEQRHASQSDRRDNDRHPYQVLQLVAPFDGQRLPDQHEFQHVLCHDLSPQGFSFIAPQRPQSQLLIVALGRAPFKFLVAEIVRATPRNLDSTNEFQIGCRFLRRLAGE